MNILLGITFVFSLMTLIFLGPEYLETLRKRVRTYKKVGAHRKLPLRLPG
jgi:hypothetical protein